SAFANWKAFATNSAFASWAPLHLKRDGLLRLWISTKDICDPGVAGGRHPSLFSGDLPAQGFTRACDDVLGQKVLFTFRCRGAIATTSMCKELRSATAPF